MQRLTKQSRSTGKAKKRKFSTDRRTSNMTTQAARTAAFGKKKRLNLPLEVALQYYRPLKKPITVRIDADVLAWFKKDGKRYQTRINQALRKVMERERKAGS